MVQRSTNPAVWARCAELLCACVLICLLGRLLATGAWLSAGWMPVVLFGAVLVPTRLRGWSLASLGLRRGRLPAGIVLALIATAAGLLLAAAAMKLTRAAGLPWPMSPSWPRDRVGLWVLVQFTHVALPEEFFFRGYLQGELAALLKSSADRAGRRAAVIAILVGATLFAASHAVIWGHPGALLTFFPGLVMGWLYWKTDSLLAPIVFHGCANIGYAWLGG